MKLTSITTAKKHGFTSRPIHKKTKRQRIRFKLKAGYLKEKSSFFVAVFSLFAFIAGNMMGQHGWHTFWASVLGANDDSLIIYTGTVAPIEKVPNYAKWAQYGGDPWKHTFRQVPQDVLVPLPSYDVTAQREENQPGDVFSTGNMGDYESGAEGAGSHPGVDIRTPVGTPIRSIAAGVVESVGNDAYGFGKYIVVRHPHIPDPANPKLTTVLYSSYAHLSAQFVEVGQVVDKAEDIGLSGMTGMASGPHLHFQVDRDTAPFHPYWPFSATEARNAGMDYLRALNEGFQQERGYEFTVHPMLLVQANYPAIKDGKTVVVATKSQASSKRTVGLTNLRDQRREQRLARTQTVAALSSRSVATVLVTDGLTTDPPRPVIAVAASSAAMSSVAVSQVVDEVVNLDIQQPRSFAGREWETVRLTLLNADGNQLTSSSLKKTLYLRTAYGEAQFNPPTLTAADFVDGTAEVKMLPLGKRTVHVLVEPLGIVGPAMEYKAN